jgi:hypothetical protein
MRCLAQHTENGRNYASASIAASYFADDVKLALKEFLIRGVNIQ